MSTPSSSNIINPSAHFWTVSGVCVIFLIMAFVFYCFVCAHPEPESYRRGGARGRHQPKEHDVGCLSVDHRHDPLQSTGLQRSASPLFPKRKFFTCKSTSRSPMRKESAV